MNPLGAVKNIGRDLVDRRLWPIAIVLVVALIAVPLVLARPAEEQSAAPAPAPIAAKNDPLGGATLALIGGDGQAPLVAGGFKDPFRQQHLPAPPKLESTTATAASDTTSSDGSVSGGDGNGSTEDDADDKPPPKEADTTIRALVRFGRAGSDLAERKIETGSPLPSTTNPIVIYLGLQRDGKTAQFLVSSDALAQGDGKCTPDATVCATVMLKPGQTEFFDVASSGATPIQYQLDYLGPKVG